MPVTVFTAGHQSPRGTFYPHDAARDVSMPSEDAARFLRSLRIIDPELVTDPGHALVRPVAFADWMTGPLPVPFQGEAHALVRLCDLAKKHDLLIAWGY